jgi:hypothetical protein
MVLVYDNKSPVLMGRKMALNLHLKSPSHSLEKIMNEYKKFHDV